MNKEEAARAKKQLKSELEYWTNLYWAKEPIKRNNQIENLIWSRMCELRDGLKSKK